MKALQIFIITEEDLENHGARDMDPHGAVRKVLPIEFMHNADYIAIEMNSGQVIVVKDRFKSGLEKVDEIIPIVTENRVG